METVKQLLQAKGSQVFSVTPQTSMFEALELMADKDIGALLVMDGDAVVGILSERAYAREGVLRGRASIDTPVRDLMTSRVVIIGADQTITECMELMTNHHIRHLPVLEDGRVIGVISISDVVKAIISNQQSMISQLERSINNNERLVTVQAPGMLGDEDSCAQGTTCRASA